MVFYCVVTQNFQNEQGWEMSARGYALYNVCTQLFFFFCIKTQISLPRPPECHRGCHIQANGPICGQHVQGLPGVYPHSESRQVGSGSSVHGKSTLAFTQAFGHRRLHRKRQWRSERYYSGWRLWRRVPCCWKRQILYFRKFSLNSKYQNFGYRTGVYPMWSIRVVQG